jgi:hypothetical protein
MNLTPFFWNYTAFAVLTGSGLTCKLCYYSINSEKKGDSSQPRDRLYVLPIKR